jgi:uncharacterized membrane protein YeaQ/YmgE (transglycosylase-associated protein family)
MMRLFTTRRAEPMQPASVLPKLKRRWLALADRHARTAKTSRAQDFAQGPLSEADMLWLILIGLLAGLIARFLLPGPNNPQGFLITIALGIAGSFLATFVGQSIGWYRHDQGAGLIGATLGAIVVLVLWHRLVVQRVVADPGVSRADLPPPRR